MTHPVSKDKSMQLKDGSEWVDHEDCIIGNIAGIESLRDACDKALEEGAYYGSDLGDYVGVKILEDSWFSNPQDSTGTRFGNFVGVLIFIAVIGLLIAGVFSVGRFLLGLFT